MIPSLVNYVRTEIEEKTKALLSNSYIINEVLEGLEPDVSKAFINKYADKYNSTDRTKDGKGIPVLTNYPEDIVTSDTFILVGMGSAEETSGSIGMASGGYTTDDGEVVREHAVVQVENYNTLRFELSNAPDTDTIVIPDFAYAKDSLEVSGTTVFIRNLDEGLVSRVNSGEDHLYVNYAPLGEPDKKGMARGYQLQETATVLIISKNLDDIRAIDALLKAVVVLMRSDSESFTKYNLGSVSYSAPVPLEDAVPGTPKITFGRELDFTFTVDYSMNSKNVQNLKKVLVDFRQNLKKR